MKLLLTDSGLRNASIRAALVELLGKPIAESRALCIPTAGYGGPGADPGAPWRFISGRTPSPMTELGWKSVGVLELTALPTLDEGHWMSWVREADVVDFSMFPHLDAPDCPENTMAAAGKWAARIPGPAYATDDQTAIKVTGGGVEVVSEGRWQLSDATS